MMESPTSISHVTDFQPHIFSQLRASLLFPHGFFGLTIVSFREFNLGFHSLCIVRFLFLIYLIDQKLVVADRNGVRLKEFNIEISSLEIFWESSFIGQ